MNATSATIFNTRPMSTNERAKLFSRELASRTKSSEHSPTQSLSSSLEGVQITTPRGYLIDVKYYLERFEARLHEARVGQTMVTSNATTDGRYNRRDERPH